MSRMVVETKHRGLGALICEKFAAEGSNVAINYHSDAGAAKEVAKNVEAHGVKAIIIQAVSASVTKHPAQR